LVRLADAALLRDGRMCRAIEATRIARPHEAATDTFVPCSEGTLFELPSSFG
jgi:hypothetical protein